MQLQHEGMHATTTQRDAQNYHSSMVSLVRANLELERGETFFFRIAILMASDGYRLDELPCALLSEFNAELFIVVPFLTLPRRCELECGEEFFLPRSSYHGLGWWWFCWAIMYVFLYFQNQGAMWWCPSFSAPSEALKLWNIEKVLQFLFLWIRWSINCMQ